MERRTTKCVTALLGAALALLAAPPSGASPRTWQPLILRGRQLPALVGTHIDHIEVLACRAPGGALAPIPFQVDKVLPDGRIAAPRGPHPEPATHPDLFGNHDQLVVMIADLGPPPRSLGALPAGALQVEVDDPLGGPRRFAYVASVASPRISHANYVDYDAVRDRIESQHYRFGMTGGLATDLALKSRMQDRPPDLIDRFKSRVHARILKFFSFDLNENDIENHLLAYRDGHLRVIRRVAESARIGLGLSSPDVQSSDYFYRDFIKTPFHVKFPWVPNAVFGDVHVFLYYDFVDLKGFQLLASDAGSAPIRIGDGASERRLAAAQPSPSVHWLALRGHGHMLMQILVPAPDARAVKRRLYFVDSHEADPPEHVPGNHPGVGYELSGWENLSSGPHHFESVLVNVAEDSDPQEVLRELVKPPVVRVGPVAPPGPLVRSGG